MVPREIKDTAYAKSRGANKVYNGRCANGELEKSKKGKSPFSLSIPPSFSFTSPPLLTVPHASGNKVSFIHDVSSLFPSRQGWDLTALFIGNKKEIEQKEILKPNNITHNSDSLARALVSKN